mgnify:CR=1 FL=1
MPFACRAVFPVVSSAAMATPKIALLAGASGLVGSLLLDELLATPEYSRVYALSRRPLHREHPRLANRVVRFEQLAVELKGLAADDAFCCLGTTIAKAGSKTEFRRVDVADTVPGAKRLIIEGMGHALPITLWPRIVDAIAMHAEQVKSQAKLSSSP